MKKRIAFAWLLFLPLAAGAAGLPRVRAQGELRWAGDLQGGEPYVFRNPKNPKELIGFEVENSASDMNTVPWSEERLA